MFKNNLVKTVLFFALFIMFSSCSKTNNETSKNADNQGTEKISSTNFNESDEDLFTIDYKEFYDQLAPHGQWIEVTGDDVGINVKRTASIESEPKRISFADYFGVSNVEAADINMNSFFVWQPAPDLNLGLTTGTAGTGLTTPGTPAVGITTGSGLVAVAPATSYVPYTNGQWVNTDAGWNFKAPTDYEETTSHYGRWNYSPSLGWTWMPGRVWSPAWVDWKEDDNNIAWAPLPPSTYIVNNNIINPVISDDNYIIVEKKNFVQPEVYKYMYKENRNIIMIKEMRRREGVIVRNNVVYNMGPDITLIRQVTNLPLEPVKIQWVTNRGDVKINSAGYTVYNPEFIKFEDKPSEKSNERIYFSKPEKFSGFKETKSKKEEVKNEEKQNKNESKQEEKGYNKEEKKKLSDDSDMRTGKTKDGNKEEGKRNNPNKEKPAIEKVKEEKHDKEKPNKEKDDGKDKDKGHDKEKKNDDNGKDKDKGDGKGKNK